jgi:hypothetical protein
MAYASPPELPVQSIFSQTREEVSQMITRPKNQIELAKNLKFILDHDLELKDDFYTESSLIDAFNLDEVVIDKTDDENGDIRVSVISAGSWQFFRNQRTRAVQSLCQALIY